MGAILLDGCHIPAESMVAAGALVSPGKTFPSGYLIVGSPAVAKRPLTDAEKEFLRASARNYCHDVSRYLPQGHW
jgi:carbonic anhydrase/acetyltransferase-like protein (isoleucine patch superfamily)